MIVTGLTLAGLTALGFFLIYRKMPKRIRRWMQKHYLMTDAVACLLTYALLGGTLVALFAAAWMGIMVTTMLAIIRNPDTNLLLERLVEKLDDLRKRVLAWLAQQAQEKKEKDAPQLEIVA